MTFQRGQIIRDSLSSVTSLHFSQRLEEYAAIYMLSLISERKLSFNSGSGR